ncbi:MAG: hypothetical protein LLG93_11280 [Deltaproteobacteria bacterium]|nr:hypothetical protein [Deltaproteobacteria bacterium]
MASKSRETRLRQQADWEAKLQKRLAFLAGKGAADERKIAQDVQVRELKAKIKESKARLGAIDANDKRTADLAAVKAERLAKPKEEAPKAKKAEEPPPEEAKPKKKKKKEKDAGAPQPQTA